MEGLLSQWWSSSLLPHLPISKQLTDKACTHLSFLQSCHEPLNNHYHTLELTVLEDVFAFHEINHSVRNYMPNLPPTTVRSPHALVLVMQPLPTLAKQITGKICSVLALTTNQ